MTNHDAALVFALFGAAITMLFIIIIWYDK